MFQQLRTQLQSMVSYSKIDLKYHELICISGVIGLTRSVSIFALESTLRLSVIELPRSSFPADIDRTQ
jgi:hypothetical protein